MTDWLMVVLTACIVVATLVQAWYIREQKRILKTREERDQAEATPSLRFLLADSDSSTGFTVTNAGTRDIEITEFTFEAGWLPSSGHDDSPTAKLRFRQVESGHGPPAMSLPHRLRHGESFRAMFEKEKLVREAAALGGESPVHLRPYCLDSLGNKHKPDHWTVYRDNCTIAFAPGPSPGRISEEELEKLPRARRQHRYSRWAARNIP